MQVAQSVMKRLFKSPKRAEVISQLRVFTLVALRARKNLEQKLKKIPLFSHICPNPSIKSQKNQRKRGMNHS